MKLVPPQDHSPSREPIATAYDAAEKGSDVRIGHGDPRAFFRPISAYETRPGLSASGVPDVPAYTMPYTPPLKPKALGSRIPAGPREQNDAPFPIGTPVAGATPANVDISVLLGDLDDATVAGLAYDRSSNFSLSPEESAKGPALNNPQHDADDEQPAPRSLLADLEADGNRSIPPGLALAAGPDPFIVASNPKTPAASGVSVGTKLTSSAKGGRRSKTTIEQCDAAFRLIDDTLDGLATALNKTTSTVRKWYLESSKDLRVGVNPWNLYQTYCANHKDEELKRCGLTEGTDADCWPSFQAWQGDRTEAFLKTALQYDRAIAEPQTIQQ
ncbi:hypothetical protein H0H92_010262 [Tricholoma furcatifolium]|nr:hypothetical protein H0H92_010262 [Tricholoma furcatifolium]